MFRPRGLVADDLLRSTRLRFAVVSLGPSVVIITFMDDDNSGHIGRSHIAMFTLD